MQMVCNGQDADGWSPLTVAADLGKEDVVELFVKAGAAVNRANGAGGWCPLHCAVAQVGMKQTFLGYRCLHLVL